MPASPSPARKNDARKGRDGAAARRRAVALARVARAASRKVKDFILGKVKVGSGAVPGGAAAAALGAPARRGKRARAPPSLAPLPSAQERGRKVARSAGQRRQVDPEDEHADDEGSNASLGRAGEEESAGEEQPGHMKEVGQICVEGVGHFRVLRDRRYGKLITDLHMLKPQVMCKWGCGAKVWVEEGGKACCSGGMHILGPEYYPPNDAEYMDILMLPHISSDSRLLNGALAMGTLGVFPSRAMGGLGFHEQKFGHLSAMGKTYGVMYPLGSNNAFDSYLLPTDLLVDGASSDLGRDYAERLLRVNNYLGEHHPWRAAFAPLQTCLARTLTSTPTCALRRSHCAAAPWSWPW